MISEDCSAFIEASRTLLNELPGADEARAVLDNRISRETQAAWDLGYYPVDDQIEALLSLIDEDVLLRLSLRKARMRTDGIYQWIRESFFRHHQIVMPYRDQHKKVVGFVGRTLLNDSEQEELKVCKYLNTRFEKKQYLFGLDKAIDEIRSNNCVFVVEGQFDVLKAYEKGIQNVVAIGSSSLTGHQLALLKRYTNNIYLLLDNDEGGRTGADRAQHKLGGRANLVSKQIPNGYKDLDEMITAVPGLQLQDLQNLPNI